MKRNIIRACNSVQGPWSLRRSGQIRSAVIAFCVAVAACGDAAGPSGEDPIDQGADAQEEKATSSCNFNDLGPRELLINMYLENGFIFFSQNWCHRGPLSLILSDNQSAQDLLVRIRKTGTLSDLRDWLNDFYWTKDPFEVMESRITQNRSQTLLTTVRQSAYKIENGPQSARDCRKLAAGSGTGPCPVPGTFRIGEYQRLVTNLYNSVGLAATAMRAEQWPEAVTRQANRLALILGRNENFKININTLYLAVRKLRVLCKALARDVPAAQGTIQLLEEVGEDFKALQTAVAEGHDEF